MFAHAIPRQPIIIEYNCTIDSWGHVISQAYHMIQTGESRSQSSSDSSFWLGIALVVVCESCCRILCITLFHHLTTIYNLVSTKDRGKYTIHYVYRRNMMSPGSGNIRHKILINNDISVYNLVPESHTDYCKVVGQCW